MDSSRQINERMVQVIDLNAERILLASKISEDIQCITKIEKDMILSTDRETLTDLMEEVGERIKQSEIRLNKLDGMSDEKGHAIIIKYRSAWSDYMKVNAKIKNLSLANSDSSNIIAYQISTSTGRLAANEAVSMISEIVKKNEKALDKAKLDADTMYSNVRINMIIVLCTVISVAILISLWIIGSITRSISVGINAIKAVSQGDLTVNIEIENDDEIGTLNSYLKDMVSKLKETITYVATAAENISSASQQMSSSSVQMSGGATEQAASAEEVSSSMEQMVSNIQQNSDNAQQTEKIAIKAVGDIKEGSESVNKTVDSMRQIADKISIIGEIARQTNLLALNAAVEAARAGEHGKGFAVVAAEVRNLAERSQLAASEINDLSAASVVIAERSDEVLSTIVPDIQKTSKLVQEISVASIEQNTGADQINNALQQLNQVIQQNAATSEELAATSEELAAQAEQLKIKISFFKLENTFSKVSFAKVAPKPAANVKKDVAPLNSTNPAPSAKKATGIVINMNDHGNSDSLDSEYEKF